MMKSLVAVAMAAAFAAPAFAQVSSGSSPLTPPSGSPAQTDTATVPKSSAQPGATSSSSGSTASGATSSGSHASGAASASGNASDQGDDGFKKADADMSGSITMAEAKKIDPSLTQADFNKADTDKSKSLSKAEFDKWAMAKHSGGSASAPGQ